jgi:small conductance mechanosensitive channel
MKISFNPATWSLSSDVFGPELLKWSLVIGAGILVWVVAALTRQFIAWLGRRAIRNAAEFEGSSWDLGASISRFAVLAALAPVPLTLAGFDWQGFLAARGPGLFAALAIVFMAVVVANWTARAMRSFGRRAHQRTGTDDTLFAFAASFLKYAIFAVAILLALTQLGFPTASLAALLGASALAIGLALQDTLKAVAAGILLAIFRPFRIGDFVSLAGLDGEVQDISPFNTSLKQTDNKIVVVSNDQVWSEPLVNHTRQAYRCVDVSVDVAYEDDLEKALEVLKDTANSQVSVLQKEKTWVGVQALGDSGVRLRVRVWCATRDFVDVRSNLLKHIKLAFDREGLTIPYPHQTQVAHRSAEKST